MSNTIYRRPVHFNRNGIIVAQGTSSTIDIVDVSLLKTLKYYINIYNSQNNLTKQFEMLVNRSGSQVFTQVFGRIGTGINVSYDVSLSGDDISLVITNNEAYNLIIDLTKLSV